MPRGFAVRSSSSLVSSWNTWVSFGRWPFEHARRERVLRVDFATQSWRKCKLENKGR